MFPLSLQSIISNQMRQLRLRCGRGLDLDQTGLVWTKQNRHSSSQSQSTSSISGTVLTSQQQSEFQTYQTVIHEVYKFHI